MVDVPLADEVRDAGHGAGGVVEQALLFVRVHQPEQVAGLGEVVVVFLAVVPVVGRAVQGQWRLAVPGLLAPLAEAVGLVADLGRRVAVHAHGAVAVVAVERAARLVDRDLVVVHAQPVALRVAVGEQPALQHPVGREANARHHVGGGEGGLLDLGEIVVRVAVELPLADLDQRVVLLRPHLGQVEGMEAVVGRVGLGHDLHAQLPPGELAALDRVIQVALVALAVLADQGAGLGIGQVPDALLADVVELHPEALAGLVDQAVGVAAEAVHVPVGRRDAAVAHDDGDLVQRLGQQGPEVPVGDRVAQVGARVALDHVVEVRELQRVAEEEHRRVVAHQVPVAFLGVEAGGEAADVALGIGGAALAGHGREADEHVGLLADLREHLGAGVAGDVAGDGEGPVCARTLGVHTPLRDDFAVEVGELFQEPHVLQQHRPTAARGLDVLVVRDRRAGGGGEVRGEGVVGGLGHRRVLFGFLNKVAAADRL